MTTNCIHRNVLLLAFLTISFFTDLQADRAKTTIVISLDGVGWQYVGNNITNTPNFDSMARSGVKAKNMITVNPTSTIPTHMTFVTGLYPESHGIVANNFYDPALDAEYFLETDCSFFNPVFYQESEPIWITMEKQGIKTGTYFWPASTSYEQQPSYYGEHVCSVNCSNYTPKTLRALRKRIGTKHCKFDGLEHPFWKRVEETIKWMKSESPPRLVLLYFDYADGFGHSSGPNSKKYLNSIEMLDRHVVGYLMDKLKDSNMLDTTNIITISDHSMVEISSERQVDLFEVIAHWRYAVNSPGIWPMAGNSVDGVFNRLKRLNSSHITFYKKEDIPEHLHWKNNQRIPPIYYSLETGWSYRKFNHGEYYWRGGSHGWEPSEELAAIFYARGPSFKEGYDYNGTVRAIDLYPLLCHLVGIDPLPNNGSLDNMMHFLKNDDASSTNSPPTKTQHDAIVNGKTANRKTLNTTSQLASTRNKTQNDGLVDVENGGSLHNKTSARSKTIRSATVVLPKTNKLVANKETSTRLRLSEILRIVLLSFVILII